jgi:hypothetical protein
MERIRKSTSSHLRRQGTNLFSCLRLTRISSLKRILSNCSHRGIWDTQRMTKFRRWPFPKPRIRPESCQLGRGTCNNLKLKMLMTLSSERANSWKYKKCRPVNSKRSCLIPSFYHLRRALKTPEISKWKKIDRINKLKILRNLKLHQQTFSKFGSKSEHTNLNLQLGQLNKKWRNHKDLSLWSPIKISQFWVNQGLKALARSRMNLSVIISAMEIPALQKKYLGSQGNSWESKRKVFSSSCSYQLRLNKMELNWLQKKLQHRITQSLTTKKAKTERSPVVN